MSKPLKIAITGPDGSGKSTVCAALCKRLSESLGANSVQEVSVWNALHALNDPKISLLPSREVTEKYLSTLGNGSRPLFIFHALARACEQADPDSKVHLLNGYWYKYAVSELGYGVPLKNVLGAVESFSTPDLVFCLDVDPETSWRRKQKATSYEKGGEQGGAKNSEASFLSFQNRLKKYWDAVETQSFERDLIKWIHIQSTQSIDKTVFEIEMKIQDRLREGTHAF